MAPSLRELAGPKRGVVQHLPDVLVEVGGIRLVAGPEVKHAPDTVALAYAPAGTGREGRVDALPEGPADAARKRLVTNRKEGLQDEGFERRHVERRTVHLLVRQHEVADALRDRMPRRTNPDRLAVGRLAPSALEVALPFDHALESLGVMARVEADKAHALLAHPLGDTGRERIVDAVVVHVPPPKQHVGLREDRIGDALTRLAQAAGGNLQLAGRIECL